MNNEDKDIENPPMDDATLSQMRPLKDAMPELHEKLFSHIKNDDVQTFIEAPP